MPLPKRQTADTPVTTLRVGPCKAALGLSAAFPSRPEGASEPRALWSVGTTPPPTGDGDRDVLPPHGRGTSHAGAPSSPAGRPRRTEGRCRGPPGSEKVGGRSRGAKITPVGR